MKKIIQKLLNNDIPENTYYCIYLIVSAASFFLWNFFYNRYAATFIDLYIGDIWHIVIYLAVVIYILINIVDKHRNVSGLISIAAVPAAVVWGILIFRFHPHIILTVLGVCAAAFALAVCIAFSDKNYKDKLKQRIFNSLAVGKRAATLLLAAIMLCAGIYNAISLNIRAYSEQTIEATNRISEENTEYSEKLLTLDNDTWNQMSNTERLAALQIAANYMCEELDIEPITVKIGAFEGYINNTRYYHNKDVVSISVVTVERAEPDANIWAVASGVYNAYQADCVEEYRKDPDSFSRDEVSLYEVRSWADELGRTKNNSYWKYWQMDTEHTAVLYGMEVGKEFEYHRLMNAVNSGRAVLSEPMKINNSYNDLWIAVFDNRIDIYTIFDEEAVCCHVIDPVDEFEDKNKTLASLYIDENLSNEENPNAMDDVIQFADRDTIYRYAVDINNDTLEYALVGTGKIAESESEHSSDKVNWESNPIDCFFDRYILDDSTSSNADMTAYEIARKDLWLEEVKNAYRLMKASINPNQPEEKQEWYAEMVDASLEDFLAYCENGAYIEALTGPTNVFAIDDGFDGVYAGTALSGYHMRLLGDMYRAEALRIYVSLEWVYGWEDTTHAFVFDESEFLSTVTEKYDIILVEE